MEDKVTVTDELAAQYELHDILGEGGQGSVYTTNFDKILVKFLNKNISNDKKNEFNKRMRFLRRLNLNHLNISLPIVLLANEDTGYVMEVMDEMIPLSKLLVPEDDDVGHWYLKTGGIKRRLSLLLKLAKTVNDIHSEGLAFGDISPTNIFISEDPSFSEIQLIDCDNITPVSDIGKSFIYTPQYGAPEMIRGESGYNTLTDAWSFSVIAFQLLTINHPFKGILFESMGVEESEKKLERGELSWIYDSNDVSNQSTKSGVPRELVISPKMMALFQNTFGLNKSTITRATIQEWIEALETVLHSLKVCSNSECAAHFLYKKTSKCPFCESKSKAIIILKTIRWEPSRNQDKDEDLLESRGRYYNLPKLGLPKVVLNQGESIDISRNLFEDFIEDGTSLKLEYQDSGALRLIPKDNKQITIRICEDESSLNYIEGKEHILGNPVKLPPGGVKKHYAVHLGEINEPHRVILFDWLGR
jgi:eukaryotic-like serine/threonine-protein kinase